MVLRADWAEHCSLTLELMTFWAGQFFVVRDCTAHCTMFISTVLHRLDASSTPALWQPKLSPNNAKCGPKETLLRTTGVGKSEFEGPPKRLFQYKGVNQESSSRENKFKIYFEVWVTQCHQNSGQTFLWKAQVIIILWAILWQSRIVNIVPGQDYKCMQLSTPHACRLLLIFFPERNWEKMDLPYL